MAEAGMIDMMRLWVGCAALLVGAIGVIFGALGLLRLRDIYQRMHGAGIIDTGGAGLILFGLLLLSPDWTVSVRLVLIGALLVMTSPTATHAIARAVRFVGRNPIMSKPSAKKRSRRAEIMSGFFVNAALISLLTLIALLAIRLHRLFAVVMLSGAFSLVAATLFVVLDAVDVAFTEAAVGAGISTILALAIARSCRPMKSRMILPLCPLFWLSPPLPCWPLRSPIYRPLACQCADTQSRRARLSARQRRRYRHSQCRDLGSGQLSWL